MCGIAGYINFIDPILDAARLGLMTEAVLHRGPDSGGFIFWSDGEFHQRHGSPVRTALAHRRLAIVDRTEGSEQPFFNASRTAALVFAGEIYNFRELRKELEAQGRGFLTSGDTEVVMQAYEEYGEECFRRFNGMWAIALWDASTGRLILSRDRLGVQPLYFHKHGRGLFFASEPKSVRVGARLSPEPNLKKMAQHLITRSMMRPDTDESFFAGIHNVPPAHILSIDPEGGVNERCYWNPPFPEARTEEKSTGARCGEFKVLFADSVRLRLCPDVTAGIMVSGGLDSSSILAMAQTFGSVKNLRAFWAPTMHSSKVERKLLKALTDEFPIEIDALDMSGKDVESVINEMVEHLDEPVPAGAAVLLWELMKKARERSCRIIFSGVGGDEALGGYWEHYFPFFAHDLRQEKGALACSAEMLKTAFLNRTTMPLGFLSGRGGGKRYQEIWKKRRRDQARLLLSPELYSQLAAPPPAKDLFGRSYANYRWRHIRRSVLPQQLGMLDRISMAFGMEARSPFLDHRIMEFGLSVPVETLFHDGLSKYALRRAMTGLLPRAIRMERSKLGLVAPVFTAAQAQCLKRMTLSRKRFLRDMISAPAVERFFSAGNFEPSMGVIFASAALWYEKYF